MANVDDHIGKINKYPYQINKWRVILTKIILLFETDHSGN